MTHKTTRISGYKQILVNPKSRCLIPDDSIKLQNFASEIAHSITQKQKYIHPKFLYNDKGSKLFEKICELPEYYLTRTEISILSRLTSELPKYLKENYRLVEFGSGSSTKTRKILDILCQSQEEVEYFSIDISNIIKESSRSLLQQYDNLYITGIIDRYEKGLEFIQTFDEQKKLIIFLGSSFGNFDADSGRDFLKKIHSTMNDNDFFLIGLDLVKDKKILESAYDDSQHITADFNLNLLSRINEELGANFILQNFEHYAVFNEKKSRIEIYLRSKIVHQVHISDLDLSLDFKKGELIHTENSYKYSISQIEQLADEVGFKITKLWQDENHHFAVVLLSKAKLPQHI